MCESTKIPTVVQVPWWDQVDIGQEAISIEIIFQWCKCAQLEELHHCMQKSHESKTLLVVMMYSNVIQSKFTASSCDHAVI